MFHASAAAAALILRVVVAMLLGLAGVGYVFRRRIRAAFRARRSAIMHARAASAIPVCPNPRAGASPARHLAGLGYLEEGFSIVESLIAAGLIASVVIGATVVFGSQQQSVAQVTVPDGLRDHVSAVDVDASALQAYDPSVRAKIQSGGMQLWTATLPGTNRVVTMQAQPAPAGVTVVAKDGSQAASIVAPLPQPKPTPQ